MNERPLWMILEDAFIIISIAALWPGILGWGGWFWNSVEYIALAGLVWILVRRMGRYGSRQPDKDGNG